MSRAFSLMVLLVACAVAGWGISVDPGISYTRSSGTDANYAVIGLPFCLNRPITVTALGVYDYGFNGLSGSLTVSIYSWNPSNPLTLGTQIVSTTLNNSSAFVSGTGSVWNYVGGPSGVPLNTTGWYLLLAEGFTYTGANPDKAIQTSAPGYYTTDSFNGAVSYGYQVLPSAYLALVGASSNSLDFYYGTKNPVPLAAGTFGVPEPSTYALMGTVGLALYLLRRRKASAKKG